MEENDFVLNEIKRKMVIEQAVRDFLHVLEHHQLNYEDGLVAWNMLGFTVFQEMYPNEPHVQTQQRMMEFSQQLFQGRKKE